MKQEGVNTKELETENSHIEALTEEQKQLKTEYETAKADHLENVDALAAQKKAIETNKANINAIKSEQSNI